MKLLTLSILTLASTASAFALDVFQANEKTFHRSQTTDCGKLTPAVSQYVKMIQDSDRTVERVVIKPCQINHHEGYNYDSVSITVETQVRQ